MIRTVLSSEEHPEYGSTPIEFPIPDESYDHMIEQLGQMGIGGTQVCEQLVFCASAAEIPDSKCG